MKLPGLFHFALAGLSALGVAACGGDGRAGGLDSTGTGEGTDAGQIREPFPSSALLPSPLIDQSRSLADILEHGSLRANDCERYFGGETDRETTLRCGKWMFFYGHMEVPGSPAGLVDLLRESAPTTVGRSFEQFGMFPDPYSGTGLPVGLSQGPDMATGLATYTLTCGSCHFSRIADGRYVVGSPNHQFPFGTFTLAVSSLPELALDPTKELPPEVGKVLGPIRDELFGDTQTRSAVVAKLTELLPDLLATKIAPPSDAAKLALAISPTGVMDPYSPPSLDDRVKIPVRMSPLWGIDPEAMTKAGSEHGAMLGSNGGAPDLEHIMRTFAFIAGQIRALPLGENYDVEKVKPLIEYIMSLSPPRTERQLDAGEVESGRRLFHEKCVSCHGGPGYAGTEVFAPQAVGTDPNIVQLLDPDGTGKALYDVLTPPEMTRGLRARRLSAVWSMTRLFHNGSARSLADVFCLEGPRAESELGSGYSTAGHPYTCAPPAEEKRRLIVFLESL